MHQPLMSFIDSGAGQSMIAVAGAFIEHTLQPRNIAMEGVSGSLVIRPIGTAEIVMRDKDGVGIILQIANCLMNPGTHNLLSLSQFQTHEDVTVDLSNTPSSIEVKQHDSTIDTLIHTIIPMVLDNGTYILPFTTMEPDDPGHRYMMTFFV